MREVPGSTISYRNLKGLMKLESEKLYRPIDVAELAEPKDETEKKAIAAALSKWINYHQEMKVPGAPHGARTGKQWQTHLTKADIEKYHRRKEIEDREIEAKTQAKEDKRMAGKLLQLERHNQRAKSISTRNRVIASFLFVAASLCFFQTWAKISRPNLKEVFEKGGIKEAKLYIANRSPRNAKELQENAYVAYREGRFEEAEKLNFQVLGHEGVTTYTKAKSYWYLGGLYTEMNLIDDALKAFDKAEQICSDSNKKKLLELILVFRSKALMIEELYWEAENDLIQAQFISGKPEMSGLWYEIYSELLLYLGDYEEATIHAEQALTIYKDKGNFERIGGAQSQLGFLYGMRNNHLKCLDLTLKAEEYAHQRDDFRLKKYNKINFILLRRVLGGEPENDRVVHEIRQWATMNCDRRLEKQLKMAIGGSFDAESPR